MAILPNTEKQGDALCQVGGWQPEIMARRRYQNGSIRKRGKRDPVWELQWWTDYIAENGVIRRKREPMILGSVSEINRRQAHKLAPPRIAWGVA
jgi:hypothetical protein